MVRRKDALSAKVIANDMKCFLIFSPVKNVIFFYSGFINLIKICTERSCLRTVCGTIAPPPHGVEIKKKLTEIIGEENCYFF